MRRVVLRYSLRHNLTFLLGLDRSHDRTPESRGLETGLSLMHSLSTERYPNRSSVASVGCSSQPPPTLNHVFIER